MARTVTTYDIQVYPLVYKFLCCHFDCAPFLVSSAKNPYASFLEGGLDRFDHRDTLVPRKYERLTASLTIGISDWQVKRVAVRHLSKKKVADFNDFVRQTFFDKLTCEVAMHTGLGMGLKRAIQRFLDRYGITEDELPIDIAIRYYYRLRRKMMLHYCPVSPAGEPVNLPHGNRADWGQESRGRQMA